MSDAVATPASSSEGTASSFKKTASSPLVLMGGLGAVGLIGSFFYLKKRDSEKADTQTQLTTRITDLEKTIEEQAKKIDVLSNATRQCLMMIERQQGAFSQDLAAQFKDLSAILSGLAKSKAADVPADLKTAAGEMASTLKHHPPRFRSFLVANGVGLTSEAHQDLATFVKGQKGVRFADEGRGGGGRRGGGRRSSEEEDEDEDERPARREGQRKGAPPPSRRKGRREDPEEDDSSDSGADEPAPPPRRQQRNVTPDDY